MENYYSQPTKNMQQSKKNLSSISQIEFFDENVRVG